MLESSWGALMCEASAVHSVHHPSPLSMRALPSLWLTSTSPDLDPSTSSAPLSPLTSQEQQELMRPKHMSESYTQFELPLRSDEKLFQRYVNAQGGFRKSTPQPDLSTMLTRL